jgi:hypothetical protein
MRDKLAIARRVAVVAALLAAVAVLFATVNRFYPVGRWLFWRYAFHAAVALVFGAACWLSGAAVRRRLGLVLPRGEREVISFALGLYLFFLVVFLGGLLHLLHPAFAVAVPIALIGVGLPGALRAGRRVLPVLRRGRRRPWSALTVLLVLGGLAGLVLVYIPILTPENAAADARWYHLVQAEHNVAQGAIARLPEGSFVGAYPQLATTLYTWAFLLPRTTLFDRIELAAHVELMIFLWTLAGVGVLTARVLARRHVGGAWAAIFLFPGIFLYDSNLSIAADHILAFWAPPIFLTLLRAWPRLEPRRCLALAVMLAGAALTKFQAGCLVLIPALAIFARALWLSARTRRHLLRWWRGPLLAAGGVLLFSAPLWAKNLLWYHDPFYPLLHGVFPSRPWTADASRYFNTIFRDNLWRPTGTPADRWAQTARALFTFSFDPHDWAAFHGKVPVFGSLFTLTSLALPFVRARPRLWGLVGCSYGALLIWFLGSHQDRYLQAFLPWMAAVTAAVIALCWEQGRAARVGVTALVALQVIWGGDVPFIPTHAFISTTPYKTVVDFLGSGYRGEHRERLRPYSPWPEISRTLPKGTKALVHGDLGPLGLGHMTVTDMTGWQGGISYGRFKSPAEMHAALVAMGVTHIIWLPDWTPGLCSVADDLVFYDFVEQYTEGGWTVGAHRIARLSQAPPPATEPRLVLVLGTGNPYRSGLHPVDALTVPDYGMHDPGEYPLPVRGGNGDEASLIGHAGYVVFDSALPHRPNLDAFKLVMRRRQYELWARIRGGPAPAPL